MAEPFRDPLGYKTKKVTLVIISVVGVAVILAGVWVGLKFNQYRDSGGLAAISSAPAMVSISEPLNGAQIELGDSIIVSAMALGPNPFLSMELWLDGQLAGVQAAPTGGMHPFDTHFSWLPVEPGYHSLIAAAVDSQGKKTMSAQVVVLISESEQNIALEISDQIPEVYPAPPDEVPAPTGPGGGETTGPSSNWGGSPGDWVNSLTQNEKPAAPELAAEAQQCSANLQIHDLSDNEEGFIVYRYTTNSPAWLKVAILSSQPQVDWITYLDQGVAGAVSYYVAAFNSQGESESNLVLVNIDPAGCPDDESEITASSIDLTLQIPDPNVEKVYCYQSPDGVNWSRWPQLGFLMPDEAGVLPEGPLELQRNQTLDGNLASLAQKLFMECWGWQGGELIPLGNFSAEDLSPLQTGKQTIVGEGLAAEVALKPVNLMGLGDLFPIGEGIADIQMNPLNFSGQKLKATSPEIPRVILSVTTDREECGKWLPPDAQNPIGALIYCFPYPEYDVDKGATIPQHYLTWTWNPSPQCIGGNTEECKSYYELLSLAESNGGQVGFEVAATSSKGHHSWTVTEPYLRMFVQPPITCAGDMQFNVRMWYQPGHEGVAVAANPGDQITEVGDQVFKPLTPNEILYGPFSNTVSLPCIPYDIQIGSKILKKQYLDITFESVEFFEIDDDDTASGPIVQEVELYGYFKVFAPSMGTLKDLNHCFTPGLCDDDEDQILPDSYLGDRNRYLNVGDWEYKHEIGLQKHISSEFYYLQHWKLCQSTNKYGCHYEGIDTSYKTNNNTLEVFVTDGDALTLEVYLIDYDALSDDDYICYVTQNTSSRSLEQWAKVKNQEIMFYGQMTTSGRCTVKATINAVNP
jgi:hypothetical protein